MTQQIEKSDAEILAEAREYLEQYGWCQGNNQDSMGHVCTYGAVVFSQGWQDEDRDCKAQFQPRLIKVLAKVVNVLDLDDEIGDGSIPGVITNWNDEYAESQEEVEDAFMKAEKIERNGNV